MGAAVPTGLLLEGEESMAGGMEVRLPARGEGILMEVVLSMAAICMGGRQAGGADSNIRARGEREGAAVRPALQHAHTQTQA